jgi:hypothetical protein
MSAPNLQYPPAAGGGTPVGGSGTVNTLPIWVAGSTLGDSAITQQSGCIATLTLTNAGSAGANATYRDQALTNLTGSGTGATIDLVIATNIITVSALRSAGSGYAVGDTLTLTSGGIVGAVFTVASVVAADNASGNISGQRICAGSAIAPQGISSSLGITSSKIIWQAENGVATATVGSRTAAFLFSQDSDYVWPASITTGPSMFSGIMGVDFSQRTSNSFAYGALFSTVGKQQNASASSFVYGAAGSAQIAGSGWNGGTTNIIGLYSTAAVGASVANTNTITTLYGYDTAISCFSTAVQNINNAGYVVPRQMSFQGAAHVITQWYGYYTVFPNLSNGAVISNRAHFANNDVTGRNHFRAKVFVGSAIFAAQSTAASVEVLATNTILSGTITNAGAGYTNGAYTVTLTGGSPSVAGSISVVVSGGVVTSVNVAQGGEGYAVGNVLSATITGGAGFQWTVTAVQGNGDVRLNSASAVFDASNSSTNGTKYFNRAGAGISSTTQSYYEEGSYTPTATGGWTGTLAGTWTRIGRKVFITINTTGSPNGSTGASTLTLPAGLAPARGGAGIRVKTASGTALGNGVVSVDNVSGLIQISTVVTSDNDAKTIQCEYEV